MMAKDRSLRFQRPTEVAEALAPFSEAEAVHADAVDLLITKEEQSRAVEAPSDSTGASGSPPGLRPYEKVRGRRTRGHGLDRPRPLSFSSGVSGCSWRAPLLAPRLVRGLPWLMACVRAPRPAHRLSGVLRYGCDRPARIALSSLFAGFMPVLCLDRPGWPWTARLALLVCCLRASE